MDYIFILVLALVQNISFTMVSRARNRDNMAYHAGCSIVSNSVWFVTMHYLIATDLDWVMAIPYICGTMVGSLAGAKISIYIERVISAKS